MMRKPRKEPPAKETNKTLMAMDEKSTTTREWNAVDCLLDHRTGRAPMPHIRATGRRTGERPPEIPPHLTAVEIIDRAKKARTEQLIEERDSHDETHAETKLQETRS